MNSAERLLDVLDRVGRPRILVVGDLILDRYIWGNAERVSQEAPVILLRADRREERLGGAANVGHLLRGLEAEVACAGTVGDDAAGRRLRDRLEGAQINVAAVVTDRSRPTTVKERFIGRAANRHGHQILRVDTEERTRLDAAIERELLQQVDRLRATVSRNGHAGMEGGDATELDWRRALVTQSVIAQHGGAASADFAPMPRPAFDAILVSDYDKGVCTERVVRALVDLAHEMRIPIIVDPGRGVDWSKYRGATGIKANRVEAELAVGRKLSLRATGSGFDARDAIAAGERLCREFALQFAALTLDRDGAVLVERSETVGAGAADGGRRALHVPTRPRDVYDITGAGDMVLAMLGVALAAGATPADAVRLGNVAGGLEVEKEGVVVIPREEIRRDLLVELGARPCEEGKSLSLEQVAAKAAEHRALGQRIVFTNGCFDLLHVGHIALLEEAAAQGDVLIVAVNNDASVRRLKGPPRPVFAERDRARMVAALSMVDYVLIFSEDDPLESLRRIRPDVLVKGGTYGAAEVVGGAFVESYGGRVHLTRVVDGISTSAIVESIHGLQGPHYVRRTLHAWVSDELDVTKD